MTPVPQLGSAQPSPLQLGWVLTAVPSPPLLLRGLHVAGANYEACTLGRNEGRKEGRRIHSSTVLDVC